MLWDGRGWAGSKKDSVADGFLARAPAEVARDSTVDVVPRRQRVRTEKREARHDESGRADAALGTVALREFTSQSSTERIRRSMLHRLDHTPVGVRREQETREVRPAIHEDRARSTGSRVAARLRARKMALVSKNFGERSRGVDADVLEGAVQSDADAQRIIHGPIHPSSMSNVQRRRSDGCFLPHSSCGGNVRESRRQKIVPVLRKTLKTLISEFVLNAKRTPILFMITQFKNNRRER